MMRGRALAWTLATAGVALVALAAAVQADFSMHLQGAQPTVEALYAEGGTVYVARLDGLVQALDRDGEHVLWQRDLSMGQGARALDMVSEDGDRLYVATSIDGNGQVEPIVALRKSDGAVLWRSTAAYAAAGVPHLLGESARANERDADAYRLALDTGRESPYLWAGLEHGYVVMLEKDTGAPVLLPDGSARVLVPTLADRLTPLAGLPCLRPSGIYALAVHDDQLWAARNFGGETKAGGCANPLLTSLFNRLYWLNASQLVDGLGQPYGLDNYTVVPQWRGDPIDPASCTVQCPNGRRFARPAILDIFLRDAVNGNSQLAYFSGAITGKAGAIYTMSVRSTPQAGDGHVFTFNVEAPLITHDDDDLEFEGGAIFGTTLVELGEGSVVSDLQGDATHIYAGTWQNQTQGMGIPPGGFALKFGLGLGFPVDWRYTTSMGDGIANDVPGRSWEAGDVNALFVEPGEDGRVLVAHGNAVPPFPGPGQPHEQGALVVETPKLASPVPVLMRPYMQDILGGQAPVAFRTDNPVGDAQSPVDAVLQYTIGMDGAQWTTVGNLRLPSAPGNDYSVTNNVPTGLLPERDDLRLRIQVTGRDGQVATDMTDGLVTVDRTAPDVSRFGVVSAGTRVAHQASGNPTVRTATPTFFVEGLDPCRMAAPACGASDIDMDNSFLWIDDPSHTYPFLAFEQDGGYVRGFTFDMALPHTFGSLPASLADGPHVVHAELVDFAGNYDFERWTIEVDTGVQAPSVSPLNATWVADDRPTWTLQFKEDVEIQSVRVDGALLAGGYQVYPKHATQNPDGTRVAVRVPAALADGATTRLEVVVRDRAGNLAGPFTSTLRVDRTAPVFEQAAPMNDALLPDARPTISLQVRDLRSGLAAGSLRVLLDDQEQGGARLEADRVVLQPATPLASGRHDVRVEATDLAGNGGAHSWSFLVDTQAPPLALQALVPDGQTAAKRGDTVRIEALSPGAAVTVTIDARALDPAAKAVVAKPDGPGRYVAAVNVTEARTGSLQLLATAVDAAGHKGTAQAFVLVDNRPPVAFMRDLPAKVAHGFVLTWGQDGEDDAAYYVLEQKVGDGAWQVVDGHVTGESYAWSAVNAPATLRFRVTAVDGAGNRQSAPSNTVETLLVQSPIDTLLAPDPWPLNGTAVVTLTPVDGANLRNVTAYLTLPDGQVLSQQLAKVGTLFRGTWDLSLAAGTGRLDVVMEDAAGIETRASFPVSFQAIHLSLAADDLGTSPEDATRGVPGASPLLVGLALVALAMLARRRR